VLGQALSPEPTELSLFKPLEAQPGPDKGLQWAQARLQISKAWAQGSKLGFDILWSSWADI